MLTASGSSSISNIKLNDQYNIEVETDNNNLNNPGKTFFLRGVFAEP